VLPYIPHIVVQIGSASVPPIALLAAVHGIALAVRAGASGRVYRWAVSAVAAIGLGAFAVSFVALRDLLQAIGYSTATAWIFPAIIDTAVAVSTLMLVALGDIPVRRTRTVTVDSHRTEGSGSTAGPNSDSERKNAVHKAYADPCAGTHGTSRRGTGLCIGTTPPGADSAGLSANRGDTGRCRGCGGPDRLRRDDTTRRDGACSPGGQP